jgi:hypothetical protein
MDWFTGLMYEVVYRPLDSKRPKAFVAQYLYSIEENGRTRLTFSGEPLSAVAWIYADQVTQARQTDSDSEPTPPRSIQ